MIEQFIQRLLPRMIVKVRGQSLQVMLYQNQQWQEVDSAEQTELGLFGQQVLLIPDSKTYFRSREFPLAHVKEASLEEAISLDIRTWAPWDGDWESFFWPSRENGVWQVAVWIWPRSALDDIAGLEQLCPTHVMPECAWKLASINNDDLPAINVDKTERGEEVFTLLSSSGTPLQISECSSDQESQRFWNSLETEAQAFPILDQEPIGLPRNSALSCARQDGVQDWTDPLGWAKPIAFIIGLYLFWLLGSTFIYWQKNAEISQQVVDVRREATEILSQRENVDLIHTRLLKLAEMRMKQSKFQSVLATLSQTLPEGAWLNYVQFDQSDGGWLDIDGQAPQSSGLAAVLEEMPEVEHAMFVSDIRQDSLTGLEPFKIRLRLKASE